MQATYHRLPLQHGTGGLGTARRYDTSAMQGRLETLCTKRLALHLLSGSQGRRRLPAACVIAVPSKGDGELGKIHSWLLSRTFRTSIMKLVLVCTCTCTYNQGLLLPPTIDTTSVPVNFVKSKLRKFKTFSYWPVCPGFYLCLLLRISTI